MDYSMPSSSSSLFNIPQLAEDGSNWVTYKHRMTIALGAHGLGEYVDGTVPIPTRYVADSAGILESTPGKPATADEIKENMKEVNEYTQKDSLVQQHIFSTITDRLMLQLGSTLTGAAMWAQVKKLHEGKSMLVKVDMRKRMLLTHCDEGADVRAHFGELNRICQIMAGMGEVMQDIDYGAIIMGSLPDSYRLIISSLEATAGYAQKVVTPQELIAAVTVEYEHQLIRNPQAAKRGGNAALTAGAQASARDKRSAAKDVTCYNCNRTGHFKSDCWAKGGGKEGQRPGGQGRRGGGNYTKPAANTAATAPPPPPVNFAFASAAAVPHARAQPQALVQRGAIIDSGATSHFCPDRARFITFTAISR
jgi:hypothetical protein